MKTYYLQQNKAGQKLIDEVLHDKYELIDTTEAKSWKEAKANFGFGDN